MTSENKKNELMVTSVSIKNVLGIEEFAVESGKITVLRGRNGVGKSSAIKAIQNAIGGGNISEIRNINSEEPPEIVLELNGEEGHYIVSKGEKKTSVKKQVGDTAAFEDVKSPQAFLSSLFDGKLSNPISFLRANDKTRVQLILEALDLDFDEQAMWDAMNLSEEDFELAPIPAGMHPLNTIAMVRENVFRERTGVNRDEKQKRSTVEQTRRSVPAEIPTVENISEKQELLTDMKLKKQEMEQTANEKFDALEKESQRSLEAFEKQKELEIEAFKEKLSREYTEKISVFESNCKIDIDAFSKNSDSEISIAKKEKESALAEIKTVEPEIEELAAEIATLREQEKNVQRIQILHDQANKFEKEANTLKSRADSLTAALTALDNYKANMCENLPVPGLDITDNVVTINGVKWSQLNTAQQIKIAVQIACIRAKSNQLPIVWVDGAEALDNDSFELMRQNLENEGVQAFIGKVENHELEVEK